MEDLRLQLIWSRVSSNLLGPSATLLGSITLTTHIELTIVHKLRESILPLQDRGFIFFLTIFFDDLWEVIQI
jgi:hypothetical protein